MGFDPYEHKVVNTIPNLLFSSRIVGVGYRIHLESFEHWWSLDYIGHLLHLIRALYSILDR